MQIFENKKALTNCISLLKEQKKQIGFVPTMGALHPGHLSLLKESQKNNPISIVTIFVNPTQFNKEEDLINYPKTLEKDLELLKIAECDIVFIPTVNEIYTEKIASKSYAFGGIENEMEGRFRNGHFDGVATIVQAFFEIIKPDNAYFGEKDFQQLQIVKKLAEIENLPVTVIGCPIFREKDGLAMSSRNMRLTQEQRNAAPLIYQVLSNISNLTKKLSFSEIYDVVKNEFAKNVHLKLEYFIIANEENLQEASSLNNSNKQRAFIAVNADNVRLIDNIPLN